MHSVSSEFKHFNIYRSNSYFDDVTSMTPHVSGAREPGLQRVEVDRWKEFYPSTNVPMYYAVTVVYKGDREETTVHAKKVQAVSVKCCC